MMYLHIGNGKSVKKTEVIGIFDLDSATVSKITRNFIGERSAAGRVEYRYDDLPRAVILLRDERGEDALKLSRLSSGVLRARAESDDFISPAGEGDTQGY